MADASTRRAYAAARWRWLDAVAEAFEEPMVFKVAYLIIGRMGRPDEPLRCAYSTLAERAHCSVDTIRRNVQLLADKGFLKVNRGGGHISTTFNFDWAKWVRSDGDDDAVDVSDIPF